MKSKHPSSVPTGKGQTDVKSSTSLEASLATRAEILYQRVARCKRSSCDFRHLPCVVITSLETGASMAIIACIDTLMVRRNPARSRRKRVLEEQLRF